MFFLTYLIRELRRRSRQAIFIALGLAVGVGLVITVTAASAGVRNAQAGVLKGLYGVGTDLTVTAKPPAPPSNSSSSGNSGTGTRISLGMGPGGAQICTNGQCKSLKNGYTLDTLAPENHPPMSATSVAKVRGLHGVAAAAGGLLLTDNQVTISQNPSPPTSFTVDGTDLSQPKLGPLSNAALSKGRMFTSADASKDVAVVDSGYATSNKLKVGKTVKVGGVTFTIIGLVTQPQGSNPADIYIPLARAQAVGTNGPDGKALKNDVNTIYVTAASASDISAVQAAIAKALPSSDVTSASSLASEVTGSLTSTAKLANDLGKWLSVLVLIAAFALAVLLTMAAVSRRVSEFGTLKAMGWRGRRIIVQVMGESAVVGLLGAALGVGFGFAGAAIINKIAPKLTAILTVATGQRIATPSGVMNPTSSSTISVPMVATVSATVILIAVLLALAGGLLAGSFASWRISRLRPAAAIGKVG
ncbi:MAG TPA: ABC transporter permease [Trebonia sp.]|nr:ABC transporter permease [Trebonia sp.]